jgi:SAM-dependent methyltransferase
MNTPWDKFYREKIVKMFSEKKSVLDIGGSLRLIREKNNRYEPANEWMRPLLEKVEYKIMDPVDDFHPDIIGDIHHMPFADNTLEAVICLAVLEHVENPIQAWNEIYRTLKPGGLLVWY